MSTFRYYENFLGTTAGKILTITNSNVNVPLKLPAMNASNVTNIFLKFVTVFTIVSSSRVEILNRSTFILGSSNSTNANFDIYVDMKKIFNAWQSGDRSYARISILSRFRNVNYSLVINNELPFRPVGLDRILSNNSYVDSNTSITSNRFYQPRTVTNNIFEDIYTEFLILNSFTPLLTNSNNSPYCFSLVKYQSLFSLSEIPDFSATKSGDSFVWNSNTQKFISEPMNDLFSYYNFVKITNNYALNITDVPAYRKLFCIIVDVNISNISIDLGDPVNYLNLKVSITCRTSNSNISVVGASKIIVDSVLNPVISLGGSTQSNLRRSFISNGSFWYCVGK